MSNVSKLTIDVENQGLRWQDSFVIVILGTDIAYRCFVWWHSINLMKSRIRLKMIHYDCLPIYHNS